MTPGGIHYLSGFRSNHAKSCLPVAYITYQDSGVIMPSRTFRWHILLISVQEMVGFKKVSADVVVVVVIVETLAVLKCGLP